MPEHMRCLRQGWILSLETERFENRLASARHDPELGIGSRHTLKLLTVFNCSGSKRSPFFQIFKTIAAILRAKVRRAIAGFIPLASKF